MQPYSMDLRERVVQAVDRGQGTQQEIAEIFQIAERSIRNWRQQRKETGSIAPRPHGGGVPPAIRGEQERRLREFVRQRPDATLEEIRAGCRFTTTTKTICVTLQRLGLPRKKKVPRAAERDDPQVQAKRAGWRRKAAAVDASKLVVVDQTGVTTQMQRAYGRAPQGQRVVGVVPEKHYRAATLMGGLRLDGSLTALVYEGGTDVAAALTFVKTQLAQLLHPGDILVWDNLAAHKSQRVLQAVEDLGASVWPLPPYSPDLSPIEPLWSKVKTSLRGTAARTSDALLNAIRTALQTVTRTDVEHWFEHCGYRKMRT